MATIVKYSTKRGQKLYASGCNYDGYRLEDVYNSFSAAKARAYQWCFDKFVNTPNSDAFSITSHNTFGFSCSWTGDYIDPVTGEIESALFIETPQNSYVVLLDR